MTIAEAREKCKSLVKGTPRDILSIFIIFFASTVSFGLGYLAGLDAGQVGQGSAGNILQTPTSEVGALTGSSVVVASKGGTKYYVPGCAAADRISDANKVWFVSATAAEAAGYTPATNCKGL